jgi:hypothetical protein
MQHETWEKINSSTKSLIGQQKRLIVNLLWIISKRINSNTPILWRFLVSFVSKPRRCVRFNLT